MNETPTTMTWFFVILLALASSLASAEFSHRKLIRGPLGRIARRQYIVQFDESVDDVDAKVAALRRGFPLSRVLFSYSDIFKGAALAGVSTPLLLRLLGDDQVLLVEEDHEYEEQAVQFDPRWGLDRIDQRELPLDNKYRFDYTGANVTVFVVDSGISLDHDEFGGRARCGFNAFFGSGILGPFVGGPCADGTGHGTHVAAIIGGATYGVAKEAELVGVRVINRFGMSMASNLIAGLNYVFQERSANPNGPMVVSISIAATGLSFIVQTLVNTASNVGLVVVVAAGNRGSDACEYSPAAAVTAITVGASTESDEGAPFTNFGSCVDIFAPGDSIDSAGTLTPSASQTMSGTSQAAAHVAGVAALYLQRNPSLSPFAVRAAITGDAISGFLTGIGEGSPNLLVNAEALLSTDPSSAPTAFPTSQPVLTPTPIVVSPSPSSAPSSSPEGVIIVEVSETPSLSPGPSSTPSEQPSFSPSNGPSVSPSVSPSGTPSGTPSVVPSSSPEPSFTPSFSPTAFDGPIQINCGGATEVYVAEDESRWFPDRFFDSGFPFTRARAYRDTLDDVLFHTARLSSFEELGRPLIYNIPVDNGLYQVDLLMAEMIDNAPGVRVFDVFMEGLLVLDSYDIFASTGGRFRAVIESIEVGVTDGVLTIEFVSQNFNLAAINAIGAYLIGEASAFPSEAPTSTPQPSISAVPTGSQAPTLAPLEFPFQLNCGDATEPYPAMDGSIWLPDRFFLSGELFTIVEGIDGTEDDFLYVSERFSFRENLKYEIPTGNGVFEVDLLFSENFHEDEGLRVFNVYGEGELELDEYDIISAAGSRYFAVIETITVTVTDENLSLEFEGVVDEGKINGIAVRPVP